MDEDAIRGFLRHGRPTEVRCHLPGEEVTTFSVATLEQVTTVVRASTWYAVARSVIVAELDLTVLHFAIEQAVETERSYDYRPWMNRARSPKYPTLAAVTYHGVLAEIPPATGWVDILVRLDNGEEYTFTVETVPSLREAMYDKGEVAGWYYAPDLLVVRNLCPENVEQALRSVAPIGIQNFGILSLPVRRDE